MIKYQHSSLSMIGFEYEYYISYTVVSNYSSVSYHTELRVAIKF